MDYLGRATGMMMVELIRLHTVSRMNVKLAGVLTAPARQTNVHVADPGLFGVVMADVSLEKTLEIVHEIVLRHRPPVAVTEYATGTRHMRPALRIRVHIVAITDASETMAKPARTVLLIFVVLIVGIMGASQSLGRTATLAHVTAGYVLRVRRRQLIRTALQT